ncbi:MAG: Rpn family recombination-promoting nuclease/putative transposase, partial [Planctomycetaceae bacterium]|nr:Rpn family recombination-promoting nuclease/putative transposase [Planctomycetaceae bacterium]
MQIFSNITRPAEIAHPHDLLTRHFLVDTELFASFLECYGKTEIIRFIDFKSLRCESPITIDDKLKEVIGDLRFSAKLNDGNNAKVFLFFEHQSTKIKSFCLRCIRNLLEFYEACAANAKKMKNSDGKFPYSIVVLLYHGKKPWKKFLQMSDLVSQPPWADFPF